MKRISGFLFIACALALAGCGIKKQIVHVEVPYALVNPSTGQEIVIQTVKDERSWIGLTDVPLPDRAKNVGGNLRHGNGFEVNLDSETAAHKTHAVIVQSLRHMGYRTVDRCSTDCPVLSVSLKKFMVTAPFSLGAAFTWTMRMKAYVAANISLDDGSRSRTFDVSGHGDNIYQVISEENWETALNRAMKDFSRNFQSAMASQ